MTAAGGRRGRALLTAAASSAATLATMGLSLLATPLLLRHLGDDRFGAWRASQDATGYLALLELGLSGAMLPLFAAALAKQDHGNIQSLAGTAIRMYAAVGGASFTLSLVLGALLPGWIAADNPSLANELMWGVWISGAAALVMPLAPFRALTEAEQRGFLVHACFAVQAYVALGGSVLFALLGWGIPGQAAALTGAIVLSSSALALDSLRRHPALWGCAWRWDGATAAARSLWRLNWPTALHNLFGRLSLLTDNFIVAACLGPELAVKFYLTQRLPQLAQAQLQNFGGASWAAMAELHARGEKDAFAQRLFELTKLVGIFGVAVLGPVAAYNPTVVEWWVGAGRYGGADVNLLAAAVALGIAWLSLWGYLFAGVGRIAALIPLLALQTGVGVAVKILGVQWMGSAGPLWGTLAGTVAVGLAATPTLLQQEFGIAPRRLWRATLLPLVPGLPFVSLLIWQAPFCPQWGWLGLAAEMAAAATFFLALCWAILLSPTERAAWRRLASRLPGLSRLGKAAPRS